MTEYLDMWKNYANFSGTTTRKGYWMTILFNFIVGLVLGVIVAVVPLLFFIPYLYGLAILVPSIAIIIRRLRDAGLKWYNIFWNFVPAVGSIILIVLLCKPSE